MDGFWTLFHNFGFGKGQILDPKFMSLHKASALSRSFRSFLHVRKGVLFCHGQAPGVPHGLGTLGFCWEGRCLFSIWPWFSDEGCWDLVHFFFLLFCQSPYVTPGVPKSQRIFIPRNKHAARYRTSMHRLYSTQTTVGQVSTNG